MSHFFKDTHAAVQELQKAGFEADKAEAIIRVIADDSPDLATKQDITELKTQITEIKTQITEIKVPIAESKTQITELQIQSAELKAQISESKTQTILAVVAVGGLIIAVVKLF